MPSMCRSLVLVSLVAASPLHATTPAPQQTPDSYAQPGERVTIAPGRTLNLRCSGKGPRTVLLEAGGNADSTAWFRVQPLLARRCRLAVIGSYPDVPPECDTDFLFEVPVVAVAAAGHPLAKLAAPVARKEAARHVQLILTDRSALTEGRQFGVVNQQGWRLADLGAKHAFLRAGLGWGGMPRHMVQDDLARGTLVELALEASPVLGQAFSMYAGWRKDAPPGPAGRRFIELLRAS